MPAVPADVARRDVLCAILRDKPIHMSVEELGMRLFAEMGVDLPPYRIWQHCQALHIAGYLSKLPPDPVNDHPARFGFIPPEKAGPHRQVELIEQDTFTTLAVLAGDKGPTR